MKLTYGEALFGAAIGVSSVLFGSGYITLHVFEARSQITKSNY